MKVKVVLANGYPAPAVTLDHRSCIVTRDDDDEALSICLVGD